MHDIFRTRKFSDISMLLINDRCITIFQIELHNMTIRVFDPLAQLKNTEQITLAKSSKRDVKYI